MITLDDDTPYALTFTDGRVEEWRFLGYVRSSDDARLINTPEGRDQADAARLCREVGPKKPPAYLRDLEKVTLPLAIIASAVAQWDRDRDPCMCRTAEEHAEGQRLQAKLRAQFPRVKRCIGCYLGDDGPSVHDFGYGCRYGKGAG